MRLEGFDDNAVVELVVASPFVVVVDLGVVDVDVDLVVVVDVVGVVGVGVVD